MKCAWVYDTNELMQAYHDYEWGKPTHDERMLFELLSLELMQAGLSWQTIIDKRQALCEAFFNFEIKKVARITDQQLEELMKNSKIIRNRKKIRAIINNAQVLVKLHAKKQSLNDLLWQYVDYQPIINHYTKPTQVPSQTQLSKKIATDLKKMGFKFVGPTIIYSFLQASGIVNDHLDGCPCK